MSAIASGSLACLDGITGEQVENACEQAVFADAQNTARAVAYISARLSLLSDVATAAHGDRGFLAAFATGRRAIELDRYGIAAHVLSVRDGCTTERCAALAIFEDIGTLKANLKRARSTLMWLAMPPPGTSMSRALTKSHRPPP
jgi:hypothetical protein